MGTLMAFKDSWNTWELRILVVCSLLLQVFLILAANLRKRMAMSLVKFTLWSAYLLADLVATYSLGVLSRNQSKYSADDSKNDDAAYFEMQLMALWSPFLLLHLGGPDTITAFSLEDNQLWHRHGLGLAVQVTLAANILARYFPDGQLLVSSVLVFVAGVSKYGERTWALKRGSMDGLRISMLGSADPGPGYANTMNKYSARLSTTAVVGVKKYMDTCAEATKHLKGEPRRLGALDACRVLLAVNTDHRPVRIKGDGCKSVLWDGCRLAKTLELVEEHRRWEIVCTMLLEMLCYVAIHCRV